MSAQAREALEFVARQLGFSALGVANPRAAQGSVLRDWLAQGAHAGMAWMERHLEPRLDPELVLPELRSVVMLTWEYARHPAPSELGRIARYAQGLDYHKLLKPKLADLDECLQLYGGVQRCFSDSGPVSERFFAWQAGLGWLGRNGLLIRKKGGSYCVLASILTTLELPFDEPMASGCGRCTRCEQACPTAALKGGSCDARRCLSYWTIEAKTAPPAEIEAARADWFFGCDACQEACPWNARLGNEGLDTRMLMPAYLQKMSPEALDQMGEQGFKQWSVGSPLSRAGYEKLCR